MLCAFDFLGVDRVLLRQRLPVNVVCVWLHLGKLDTDVLLLFYFNKVLGRVVFLDVQPLGVRIVPAAHSRAHGVLAGTPVVFEAVFDQQVVALALAGTQLLQLVLVVIEAKSDTLGLD